MSEELDRMVADVTRPLADVVAAAEADAVREWDAGARWTARLGPVRAREYRLEVAVVSLGPCECAACAGMAGPAASGGRFAGGW